MDEIQRAVNNVRKKILKASHEIRRWGNTDLNGDEENVPGVDYDNIGTGTFYDEIASDIEIVKLVLLLTGSVNGLKNEVQAHLDAYAEYSFLYLENLQQAYDDFTRKKPSSSSSRRSSRSTWTSSSACSGSLPCTTSALSASIRSL